MSSFRLRSQQDGTYKEYTLAALLHMLGDPVNDEIMIGEDVLNLSSFQEISGSGGGSPVHIPLTQDHLQVVDGSNVLTLARLPATRLHSLTLNGLELKEGIDYTVNGRQVTMAYNLVNKAQHQDMAKAAYD